VITTSLSRGIVTLIFLRLCWGPYENSSYQNGVWRFLPQGSSAKNPSHTYNLPGNYTVTLQSYNSGGYDRSQKTGYIVVQPNSRVTPGVNVTLDEEDVNAGANVTDNDQTNQKKSEGIMILFKKIESLVKSMK
jgi:PKD repeat protein